MSECSGEDIDGFAITYRDYVGGCQPLNTQMFPANIVSPFLLLSNSRIPISRFAVLWISTWILGFILADNINTNKVHTPREIWSTRST